MDVSKLTDNDHLRTVRTENETIPLIPLIGDSNQSILNDRDEETNDFDVVFSGEAACVESYREELHPRRGVTHGNHVTERKGQAVHSEGANIPIIRISPTFVHQREHCRLETIKTNERTSITPKRTTKDDKEETGLQNQIAITTDNVHSHEGGSHTLYENGSDWTICQISGAESPPLPNGKEHHLFVSYSSEDRDRVFGIVTEIEKEYKLKCVFDDRDFQPGMRITDNIDNGIERSEKILVMLSDSFVQSNWCKHEVQVAFMRQMQGRVNSIIPVKLEDCAVPSTLANLTHIDARNKSTADLAEKIFKAYKRQEHEHQGQTIMQAVNPTGQTGHVIQDKRKDEREQNGFSMTFSATRQSLYECRPAKYRFTLTDVTMESLWRNNLCITVEDMCRIFRLLNSEEAVKYAEWNTLQARITFCFFIIIFLSIFVAIIYCLVMIYSSPPRRILFFTYGAVAVVLLMCVMIFISGVVIVLFFRRWKRRYRQKVTLLQKRLWSKITLETMQQGILVLQSPSKVHPTIQIMRYDIESCKSYLINYLRNTEDQSVPQNIEEFATSQLTDLLERIYPQLAENFHTLPTATQVRHRVKQGRQCLCQMLEEQLFK